MTYYLRGETVVDPVAFLHAIYAKGGHCDNELCCSDQRIEQDDNLLLA